MQCKKFNDMQSTQRAQILEKFSACARCTSWSHQKSSCYMPVTDCREMVNGSMCHKDHSKLVCNSGIAYCLAARSQSSATIGDIDVMQPTIPYCQDIIVNKQTDSRVFWDDGSSRVLINNDFAKENNL